MKSLGSAWLKKQRMQDKHTSTNAWKAYRPAPFLKRGDHNAKQDRKKNMRTTSMVRPNTKRLVVKKYKATQNKNYIRTTALERSVA